jgi:sulfur carrier protein ThiS
MIIKMLIVPGKLAKVTVPAGSNCLQVAKAAAVIHPDVKWVELTGDREVRVQNRKFSNTDGVPDGYFGSIKNTALKNNDVVLILTKIKGNVGDAVLQFTLNGEDFCAETPITIEDFLKNVVNVDLAKVSNVKINGTTAALDQLIGNCDALTCTIGTATSTVAAGTVSGDALKGINDHVASLEAKIAELEGTNENKITVLFGHINEKIKTLILNTSDDEEYDIANVLENEDLLSSTNLVYCNGSPITVDDFKEYTLDNGDSLIVM